MRAERQRELCASAPDADSPAGVRLHRRFQRVVVPGGGPGRTNPPLVTTERRERATTLVGMGARESFPTLPDWEEPVLTSTPRARADALIDLEDADAEQLLFDAEQLALTFDVG